MCVCVCVCVLVCDGVGVCMKCNHIFISMIQPDPLYSFFVVSRNVENKGINIAKPFVMMIMMIIRQEM